MAVESTRRAFLRLMTAGGALGAWRLPVLGQNWGLPGHATASESAEPAAGFDRQDVQAEIRRRASWQLQQNRLVVDYYRIGRQVAYPLPLAEFVIPEVPVPGIPNYPWATWLTWTLEERITCLGWAAEWFGDDEARQAAVADLAALARWSTYQQYSSPDLSSAHAGRILWRAFTHWQWVSEELRHALREACLRHVQAVLAASNKIYASIGSQEDILRREMPHNLLHNIPLIGTIGAALTAASAGHAATALLNARVMTLFSAVLDLRGSGLSEGVAYDGYVLDFVSDWLTLLPEPDRSAVLDHPRLDDYLEQSYMLSAPGAAEQVAQLSDVEPRQMPFHLSAQAKLLRWRTHPVRAWLLGRCPLKVLRSDALAALGEGKQALAGTAPHAGALDAHYAAVLRSGWQSKDLAVAVACSSSPMSHIQCDSGTLVIGTRGNWLVADPGYQQYAEGDERKFTVGPTAHNTPLINQQGPTRKQPRRMLLEDAGPHLQRVAVDLTACYPEAASLAKLVRHVWLAGTDLVVVADQLAAAKPPQATYHWHGHRDAAWWFEAGWALVALGDARLWFTCSQRPCSAADLQRLPGSRGQLSLISNVASAGPVVWWVFVLAASFPPLQTSSDGREIRVRDQIFRI